MSTGPSGGAAVGGAPSFVVGPFAGPVVYRNVRAIGGPPLWEPPRPGLRWEPPFSAVYTRFGLERSLGRRLKHTEPLSPGVGGGGGPGAGPRGGDVPASSTMAGF